MNKPAVEEASITAAFRGPIILFVHE